MRRAAIAILLILVAVAAPPQARAADVLVVAVNHAPPYRIIEGQGADTRFSGIYIDIMREIAGRAGLTLRFQRVPFRRALKLMENGRADLMVGPNKTAARERFMRYLEVELTSEAKAFYGKPGSAPVTGYAELAGKRIAVQRGARYFDPFDGDAELTKVEVADYALAVRLAARARVDLVIMPELLGDHMVRAAGAELVKGGYKAPGKPSFIAVSRKSGMLVAQTEALEQALREAYADGTVAGIIGAYK